MEGGLKTCASMKNKIHGCFYYFKASERHLDRTGRTPRSPYLIPANLEGQRVTACWTKAAIFEIE